jgi:lipid A 4'-phosphatase
MAKKIAWFFAAFILVMGPLVGFSHIDLWASGLFFHPQGTYFHWAELPGFLAVRRGLPYFVGLFALASAVLLLIPGRRRAGIYLLLALALGPGLVVNAMLKDHWGRARPAQIAHFNGDYDFTPAWKPADQCRTNCSFPAGDPSVGFLLFAPAFLFSGRARKIALGVAFAAGAYLGAVRIIQGGHFLSDVVASGFIMFGISWTLYRLIVVWDGLGALARAVRRPSDKLKLFYWLSFWSFLVSAYAYAFLDLPLARFASEPSRWAELSWLYITEFGISTPYLVISAVAVLGCMIAASRAGKIRERKSFIVHAWRAGFVFLSVAISGLIADLVKPVFGRARPRLELSGGPPGFRWWGPRADYWSFPSGHAVTMAALAFALCVLYPRGRVAWIGAALLVGLSRIMLDEHHLSDVIAGLYVGLITAWALYESMRFNGIKLTNSPGSPVSGKAKTARRKPARRVKRR